MLKKSSVGEGGAVSFIKVDDEDSETPNNSQTIHILLYSIIVRLYYTAVAAAARLERKKIAIWRESAAAFDAKG